jgi:hypothetical protein
MAHMGAVLKYEWLSILYFSVLLAIYIVVFLVQCLNQDQSLKIHEYLGAKLLKITFFEKSTCNYFLTSISLDLDL